MPVAGEKAHGWPLGKGKAPGLEYGCGCLYCWRWKKGGQRRQWKVRAALWECGAAAPAGTVAGVTEEGASQQLHAAHMTPEGVTHVGDQDTYRWKGWKKQTTLEFITRQQIPNDRIKRRSSAF